jgi:hypothetical protein
MIDWVKSNIDNEERIISVEATWLTCFADRWAISFPGVKDHMRILKFLRDMEADFIILWPDPYKKSLLLSPVISENGSVFKEEIAIGTSRFFRIEKQEIDRMLE